ncbi:unnamed protein product [Caenorhabditis brenneri]
MDSESSIYSTATSSELSEIPNPDSLNSEFPEKCQICSQQGHGYHFGVYACRACAAFFRRCHFSPVIEQRKCRLLNGKCGPNRNGRWFCKKCRLERCLELGMTTTNIQYDRDAFKSSANFVKSQALARLVGDRIGVPMTIEVALGTHHLVSFIYHGEEHNSNLPYVDTSQLVEKAINIVLNPNLVKQIRRSTNLEQLSQGLGDFQTCQKENLSEIVHISQNDHTAEFERSMCAAARWLSCSDKFKGYDDCLKIRILQSIWFVWGRLERMIMTAKMRAKKQCGKKQFVFSPDNLVDYDKMDSDISCWSSHTFDEMRFFFIPKELYYDEVIWDIVDIQPNDVELTFIMSILCFQLAGARYGGHIQDEMERLQDILSNELHEYYMKNNQKMYLLRLKQLMKVKERFLRLRNIRLEKYSLGGIFNMFNTSFSNPDFFWVPP